MVETAGATDRRKLQLEALARYFDDNDQPKGVPWQLSDFYEAVHVPPVDAEIASQLARPLSETSLYPFQQRALDWLLRREGVQYNKIGRLVPISEDFLPTPISFRATVDAAGKPIYVSHLRGAIISDLGSLNDSSHFLRGGILAEEMGLGKTVELIALMNHHKRQIPEGDVFDAYTGTRVKPSGATLIISPPSLLDQWLSELERHAPELTVKMYSGIPSPSASKEAHEDATAENIMQYDVVLSTYAVLAREIHFAAPRPDRSLRHAKRHEARKSPLVQISWWRVCLDEAQMVESGVSNAATVARMIPRCNAWAVSGTPLRKDIQDLRGLLIFLRYEPFAGSKALWDRLDKQTFCEIFGQIALRHTKDKIRSELQLPPQKRVVITVPFTAIEEQHYQEMLREMCEACGLDDEGRPLQGDWDPNNPTTIERMRGWLMRIRQTCLHANVGKQNRRALGGRAPLRTVKDVLEVMIERNDTLKKSEAREYILSILRQGHVIANDGSKETRSQDALPYYQRALDESLKWVEASREELVEEQRKLGKSATDKAETVGSDEEETATNMGRLPIIRKALRSFLELEHAAKFFMGTAYYQIKSNEHLTSPDSDQFQRLEALETEWYEKAKMVRKELLKDTQNKAQKEMNKLNARNFYKFKRIDDLPDLGGIEGAKIWDMMDDVCDRLRAQTAQLDKWRSNVVDILLLPLVDEDQGCDTTGDEYEDSTKVQDELYIYIMALRTLVADRNTLVNGLRDTLVNHELKAAKEQAQRKQGHAPELVLKLVGIREKLEPRGDTGSLKGVVASSRSLLSSLQWDADVGDKRAATEFAIVQQQFVRIQSIAAEEAKGITVLEKELEMFRGTMNLRLEFYRQLQHISDTVAPLKEVLDDQLDAEGLATYMDAETKRKERLDGLVRKETYLANLREENDGTTSQECRICLDTFEMGVMVACGHKFCKECLSRWWQAHRTCPLCKVRFRAEDLTDIHLKPTAREETPAQHQPASPSSSLTSHTAIYSDISDSTLREIKMIDLNGSYGSKIDMIARHLLWIRKNAPGSKSIIFSQFGDFLDYLRGALTKWGIGCSSIHDKNGIARFKAIKDIECFLLDAKSNSSGLNLVNATYVFLCEPLINPAIELQAIARVHRIGQQRPTTVLMYLISDTVEEAIYEISVARRLAHMGRSDSGSRSGSATPALLEKTIEAADSKEVEAAPLTTLLRKKGEGEMVQSEDLWSCLFGKPHKKRSVVLNNEVNRHLRAEAADGRRQQASTNVPSAA